MNPIPGFGGIPPPLDNGNPLALQRVDTPPVYKPPAILRTQSVVNLQDYLGNGLAAKEKLN